MTETDKDKPTEMLSAEAINKLNTGHCPDCDHRGFVLGPRGGSSINIECGGCGNRFNVAQFSTSHHFVMGHRIAKQSEGGADWTL